MADEERRLGLAVFLVTQGCPCCVLPTLVDIAVRVVCVMRLFMARHVPTQAGNETSEDYETHFVRLLFINSLKRHSGRGPYCFLQRASRMRLL
jgi:hypothetical protein